MKHSTLPATPCPSPTPQPCVMVVRHGKAMLQVGDPLGDDHGQPTSSAGAWLGMAAIRRR